MATTIDVSTALLEDVWARLDALEREVEKIREERHDLKPADRKVLERLEPAIALELGSATFAAGEIFARDSENLRLITNGLNPKKLGRLLVRAAGVPVGGLVVEHRGWEGNRRLFAIVEVVEFQGPRNSENSTTPYRVRRARATLPLEDTKC